MDYSIVYYNTKSEKELEELNEAYDRCFGLACRASQVYVRGAKKTCEAAFIINDSDLVTWRLAAAPPTETFSIAINISRDVTMAEWLDSAFRNWFALMRLRDKLTKVVARALSTSEWKSVGQHWLSTMLSDEEVMYWLTQQFGISQKDAEYYKEMATQYRLDPDADCYKCIRNHSYCGDFESRTN